MRTKASGSHDVLDEVVGKVWVQIRSFFATHVFLIFEGYRLKRALNSPFVFEFVLNTSLIQNLVAFFEFFGVGLICPPTLVLDEIERIFESLLS